MLILAGPLGEYAQPLRSRLRNRHAPPESKASIAGQLFNFALRAVSVALKAREQEELIQRLEVLEGQLQANSKEKGYYYGA
jgi:hypothetical protein